MSDKRSVTVIGAGIIGIACASWLQRDGHAVTVVSARPPGEDCSFGNSGLLSPGSVVPPALPGRVAQHSAVAARPAGSARDPLGLRAAPAAMARPLARRLPGSAGARGIERARSAARAGVRELRAAPRRRRRDRSRSTHRTAVRLRAGRRGRRLRARAGAARGAPAYGPRSCRATRRARWSRRSPGTTGARSIFPTTGIPSIRSASCRSSPRTSSTAAARCSAGP